MADRKFTIRVYEVKRLRDGEPVPRPLPKPKPVPGFTVEARHVDSALRKTRKRFADEGRSIHGLVCSEDDTLIAYVHEAERKG